MTNRVGVLVFDQVTLLDLVGPYEVFCAMADTEVYLVAEKLDSVVSGSGIALQPTLTYDACPQLDVVCVPGGAGVNSLMLDEPTLRFLKHQAQNAEYMTSVCTGALVLGAAGLLKGRRATTHWAAHDLLAAFGALPVKARVVQDGNLFTGGGVTAGIDFALSLAERLIGRVDAECIQLNLEYAPEPPFTSGSPETAPEAVLKKVRERSAPLRAERENLTRIAANALG